MIHRINLCLLLEIIPALWLHPRQPCGSIPGSCTGWYNEEDHTERKWQQLTGSKSGMHVPLCSLLCVYRPWPCTGRTFESKGAVNHSLFITSIFPNYCSVQPVPAGFTLSLRRHHRLSLLGSCGSPAGLSPEEQRTTSPALPGPCRSLLCFLPTPSTHRNTPWPLPTQGNVGV